MRTPTAAELLDVWERSGASEPTERADTLLALTRPGLPPADLPLGERDAQLLELRELLFGSELDGAADCTRCGETLEFALSTQSLGAQRPETTDEPLELRESGCEIRFRVPTAHDLADAAATGDVARARAVLLERCIASASLDGQATAPAKLPAAVVVAVAERMAEADPLADVRVALTCPACGHEWTAALDVAAWVWSEVEAWAHRTVLDVHSLASAYGWSEAEILALGPRRELYLELVEG